MVELICYLIAAILFGIAALGVVISRVNLIALGLLFAVIPLLVDAINAVD